MKRPGISVEKLKKWLEQDKMEPQFTVMVVCDVDAETVILYVDESTSIPSLDFEMK